MEQIEVKDAPRVDRVHSKALSEAGRRNWDEIAWHTPPPHPHKESIAHKRLKLVSIQRSPLFKPAQFKTHKTPAIHAARPYASLGEKNA